MAKIKLRKKAVDKLEKKIESLSKKISSFEKNIGKMDSRIDKLIESIESNGIGLHLSKGNVVISTEQAAGRYRAQTEQLAEQSELSERLLSKGVKADKLKRIRGRHREILAMLINDGFHTYKQIAKKLNISQSRARAYIAELKNKYKVPLRYVRDPEGYKVGIDVRFVEEILLSK